MIALSSTCTPWGRGRRQGNAHRPVCLQPVAPSSAQPAGQHPALGDKAAQDVAIVYPDHDDGACRRSLGRGVCGRRPQRHQRRRPCRCLASSRHCVPSTQTGTGQCTSLGPQTNHGDIFPRLLVSQLFNESLTSLMPHEDSLFRDQLRPSFQPRCRSCHPRSMPRQVYL